MLPKVASVLFALLLIAGIPFLSLRTSRQREVWLAPRILLYLSAVFSQWVLAAIGALVVIWLPHAFMVAGFRPCPTASLLKWTAAVAATGLGALTIVILAEEHGWWPQETALTYLLMPATRREKLLALALVAPTAGICEEFLYRGFLLSQLYHWCHSLPCAWALSSAVFALAHVYQGRLGVLRVALLGALLAWPAVATSSLYPAMAAHFLVDAVALLWLGPRFIKRNPRVTDPLESLARV